MQPDDWILNQFQDVVERCGPRLALWSHEAELTYAALDAQSTALAERIRRGPRRTRRVAFLADRSAQTITLLLGILKAGSAYVPLDPSHPPERLGAILEDVQPDLLLANDALLKEHPGALPQQWRGQLTSLSALTSAPPRELPEPAAAPGTYYVLFTSGSTGTPKGVEMPYAALMNLIRWQLKDFVVAAPARTLQFSPLIFDVSFQEIFSTLLSGSTLFLTSPHERLDPNLLFDALRRHRIQRLFLPYVALQLLAETARDREQVPTELREVITAGEALKVTPAIRWLFEQTGAALVNQYGPTETHVVSRYRLPGPPHSWADLPPIGTAVDGVALYVMREDGQDAAPGETGELFVGGPCLARGYLNRPELTAQKFITGRTPRTAGQRLYATGDQVAYQPDGTLTYLGRNDTQVKIRGYRVELGEIETALLADPRVKEAVTVPVTWHGGQTELVAFVVLRSPPEDPSMLRQVLEARLPAYMHPREVMVVPAFPLTSTGKIDRKRLTGACLRPPLAPPLPQAPGELAALWCRVLQQSDVDGSQDFFACGGDSLKAVRFTAEAGKILGLHVPLSLLFQHPVFSAFVRAAAALTPALTPELPLDLPEVEAHPCSEEQRSLWLAAQVEPVNLAYNVQWIVQLRGRMDIQAFAARFCEALDQQYAMKLAFFMEGNDVHAKPCPERAGFSAVDWTDLPDEAARQHALRTLCEEDNGRPFQLDSGPLFRVRAVTLSPEEAALVFTAHHLVVDDQSLELLLRVALQEDQTLPAGGFSLTRTLFLRHCAAQRCQSASAVFPGEALGTGPDLFRNVRNTTEQPTRRDIVFRDWTIPPTRRRALDEVRFSLGWTLHTTLLTAHAVAVAVMTSMRDIVIGVPFSTRSEAELQDVAGYFLRTLPLRAQLRPDQTLRSAGGALQEELLRHAAPPTVGLDALAQAPRKVHPNAPASPVQHLFVLEAPRWAQRTAMCAVETHLSRPTQSKMDLLVSALPTPDTVQITVEFDPAVLSKETVETYLRTLEAVVERLSREPDAPLSSWLPPSDVPDRASEHQGAASSEVAPRQIAGPRNVLELMLLRAWEHVLGTQGLSTDDDFFHVGGNSIRAVQLANHLRTHQQVALPVASIIQGGTIRHMAEQIQVRGLLPLDGPLVTLQALGKRGPLTLIQSLGGTLMAYVDLARQLDGIRVLGLESPWLRTGPVPLLSMEELARTSTALMARDGHRNLHFLGGWSFGGMLAFELARQLAAAGAAPPHVFLLDSSSPLLYSRPPETESLPGYLRWRFGPDVMSALTLSSQENEPELWERVTLHLAATQTLPSYLRFLDPARAAQVFQVERLNNEALWGYSPGPYPGPVTLFRAEEQLEGAQGDTLGWEKLCPALQCVPVGGSHHSLDMTAVARHLQEVLP